MAPESDHLPFHTEKGGWARNIHSSESTATDTLALLERTDARYLFCRQSLRKGEDIMKARSPGWEEKA